MTVGDEGTADDVLGEVAAGLLTPTEGARRLRHEHRTVHGEHHDEGPPAAVRVVSERRAVEVVGDMAVDAVEVSGPVTRRRDGDTLVLEADLVPDPTGFVVGDVPKKARPKLWSASDARAAAVLIRHAGRVGLDYLRERVGGGRAEWAAHRAAFRVFPTSLPLVHSPIRVRIPAGVDVELHLSTATPASVKGVSGAISGEVAGSMLWIEDITGAIDIDVTGGTAWLSGTFAGGARIGGTAAGISLYVDDDAPMVTSTSVRTNIKLGRHGQLTADGAEVHNPNSDATASIAVDLLASQLTVRADR